LPDEVPHADMQSLLRLRVRAGSYLIKKHASGFLVVWSGGLVVWSGGVEWLFDELG
jgi:hypothetical protein